MAEAPLLSWRLVVEVLRVYARTYEVSKTALGGAHSFPMQHQPMATVATTRLLFLHLPKTGGTWATSAMLAAGVPVLQPRSLPFHANLAQTIAYRDRFSFAFVRHPLEFWRSYWAFRLRDGWDLDNQIDAQAHSPDFNVFVSRLAEHQPGAASALYEQFVGRRPGDVDFVGRFERLVDDLVAALRLAGEPFDEAGLRAQPPLNVSDYGGLPVPWYRPDTAERLAASEHAAIERFYAHDPVPARLLEDHSARANAA